MLLCIILNTVHKIGIHCSYRYHTTKFSYELDIASMTEKNLSTTVIRPVKRRPNPQNNQIRPQCR